MVTLLKIVSAFLVVLNLSLSAEACFHFSKNYKGDLKEGLQEALIFHDGQDAHLVIRTNLKAKKFPKEIAWVLPFPTLPKKYEEINGPLFFEIRSFFTSDIDTPRGISKGNRPIEERGAGGIKVHDTVVVGGYTIQPIEILNEGAGNEFNAWLKKNKFNSMPYANQKYYLKKGATFLAIRMEMNLPYGDDLVSKPLHVVYSSDQITVPMKFTHDTRKFDLDLYVFSSKALDKDLSAAYLTKKESVAYENKGVTPFLKELLPQQKGYLTLYKAEGLNTEKKPVKKIKTDPSFQKTEI